MHEIFHTIEHMLGLCGEKHISLLAIINEWPSFSYAFNCLKMYIKYKI